MSRVLPGSGRTGAEHVSIIEQMYVLEQDAFRVCHAPVWLKL